ncbi:MAG: glycosyltransferase family 39 protein [Proteobacteria bacterium]|nr:glycosyltransferase family 39 protein [Pseudomonadota bacterium]
MDGELTTPSAAIGSGTDASLSSVSSWLVLAILFGYGAACVFLWTEGQWRLGWDTSLYVLTGRALALGEGYTYQGEPFLLRPPGWPWLISLALPDGRFDPLVLNRLVMLFAAAAAAAIYFALSRGRDRTLALGLTLLAVTTPLVVERFNWVLAEFPFVTFLFLCAGCLELAGRRGRHWRWAMAGAIVFGATAFYMRSAGLVVLPAIAFLGWSRERGAGRWSGAVPALATGLLCAPWLVYQRLAAAAAPAPANQLLLFDYATATLRSDPRDPSSDWLSAGDWLSRIAENASSLGTELAGSVLGAASVPLGALLLVLAFAGWVLAARRRLGPLEWIALAYTALLLVYFTHAARLVMPLIPFVYLYGAGALSAILDRLRPGVEFAALRGRLVLASFALLMLLNLLRLPLEPDPRHEGRWAEVRAAAEWLEQLTPEDAVVLCGPAPTFAVLTGRRTYTYYFDHSPSLVDRHGIGYALFGTRGDTAQLEGAIAERAHSQWTISIPELDGAYTLYELD